MTNVIVNINQETAVETIVWKRATKTQCTAALDALKNINR